MSHDWIDREGDQVTAFFVLTGVTLLALGGVVGVADNPPGIALLYGGALGLVLAGVNGWRSPRPFLRLLYGSVIGFVVMVPVHNFGDALAQAIAWPWLSWVVMGIAVAAFFGAVLVAPVAFLVGAVGVVMTWARSRRPGLPRR